MTPRTSNVLKAFALSLAALAMTASAETKAAGDAQRSAAEATRLADAAVKGAVTNLLKEVDASAKDPKALRTKCDYFHQNKSPDVTPSAIAAALNRQLGRDVPSDAYIKWQLCSGLKGVVLDAKQDPKLVKEMLSAYSNAPAPSARPGLEPNVKREMDRLITTAKAAQLAEINEAFAASVGQWDAANEPVIKYRDELYDLTSQVPEALSVALGDGYLRASRGASAEKLMKTVMASVQAWAASAPQPQVLAVAAKVKQMAKEMNGLPANADAGFRAAAQFAELLRTDAPVDVLNAGYGAPKAAPPARASFPPWFYTTCSQDKSNRNAWAEAQAGFASPAAMAALYKSLMDIAKNAGGGGPAGGGLQFKDPAKS